MISGGEIKGSGASLSFWLGEEKLPSYSPLQENISADICIIGGGIAGLTCAYLLTLANKKVIVLEDGKIGGGESSRTTGHLTYALDDRYFELERLFGEEGARMAAESHKAALSFIKELVSRENIDCFFETIDAYLFVPPGESTEILEKEWRATQKAGLKETKIVSQAPIQSFNTGPCLQFPQQAEFYPIKYLKKLAQLILDNGGLIFTETRAAEIESGSQKVVTTSKGNRVTAKTLIVATNSPINDRFIIHTKQAAYRTYVIGATCPKGYVTKALYYDTPDPYHYVRVIDFSPDKDLLLIGGEDHKTGQKKHPETCYEALESWSRDRFPLLDEIKYKWSGQIMEPIDSLGFIGKNPMDDEVYIVTGDSGNGLTHSTIAGLLITDLIEGRKNPWEKLYDPSRKNIRAAPDYIQENSNTLLQYADWLGGNTVKSVEEIPQCTGGIISNSMHKSAVYRDEEGTLHFLSAVCPHLGGIVRWNSAEKTWDCPCHGSRFDRFGRVLHGPANSDLKKQ